MTDPSRSLRELAELTTDPAIRSKVEQIADEFESQHNKQNNDFGAALGLAELGIDDKLDEIRADITRRLSDVDARQILMLKMLDEMQDSLRALQHRPPCMHPDKARDQLEAGG